MTEDSGIKTVTILPALTIPIKKRDSFNMSQTIWSESEVEQLVELAKKGLGPVAASKELGRTKDSVRHKMKWLRDQGKVSASPVAVKKASKEETPVVKKYKQVVQSQIEYCMNCKSPVSSWDDHLARMSRFGCKRNAA